MGLLLAGAGGLLRRLQLGPRPSGHGNFDIISHHFERVSQLYLHRPTCRVMCFFFFCLFARRSAPRAFFFWLLLGAHGCFAIRRCVQLGASGTDDDLVLAPNRGNPEAWDHQMVEYASVWRGEEAGAGLFYAGNGYGATGIGYTELGGI